MRLEGWLYENFGSRIVDPARNCGLSVAIAMIADGLGRIFGIAMHTSRWMTISWTEECCQGCEWASNLKT